MTSMVGNIAYVKYIAANTKGSTTKGTLFNDPFRLGTVDPNFTANKIAETHTAVEAGGAVTVTLDWTPIIDGSVAIKVGTTTIDPAKYTVDAETGVVTFSEGVAAGDTVKALYNYDNIVIPANKIPMLKAEMATLTLEAHARRIAIYYSNIAAFQAKQDYGLTIYTA